MEINTFPEGVWVKLNILLNPCLLFVGSGYRVKPVEGRATYQPSVEDRALQHKSSLVPG